MHELTIGLFFFGPMRLCRLNSRGSDIPIDCVGAKAIAASVQFSSLQHLNLRNNHIGDVGAEALFQSLSSQATITYFNLYGTQFGDRGARACAECIKANKHLTVFGIHYNKIGDAGAQAIADALQVRPKQILWMQANELTEVGKSALRDVQRRFKSLEIKLEED
eukprot:m.229081 g.229081  ORF g.229081 m.229081 type:complete len:164 (+) comp15203_c0_seq2:1986-2477(+)